MKKHEAIKNLEQQKAYIDEKLNLINTTDGEIPKAQLDCMVQHAGQCGTCTASGGWISCG